MGGLTADDIAARLGLTRSAVRFQLVAMERDGVVGKAGKRPGTTRPSYVYELTREVELLLSKAYIPVLTQLVDVFAEALPAQQLEALLRRAGRGLARELSRGKRVAREPQGSRCQSKRVDESRFRRADSCREQRQDRHPRRRLPHWHRLTGRHRGVCLAMESAVAVTVESAGAGKCMRP